MMWLSGALMKVASAGATVAVVAGGLLMAPGATADVALCRVRNLTSGGTAGSNLQAAINRARPGDVVQVSGVCVGGFRVRTSLTLAGKPTAAIATPALDGAGSQTVLTISPKKPVAVKLVDLSVQNGLSDQDGGGIYKDRGSLRLVGSTTVARSTAGQGGGIYNGNGLLRLGPDSSVIGNAAHQGGGIYNAGRLEVRGAARLADNSAGQGGGISNRYGTVVLEGASSVAGNVATSDGGGVYNGWDSVLTLRDASEVTDNDARYGGGISNEAGRVTIRGAATVSGNSASTGFEDGDGAGIYTDEGVVLLRGSASVHDNVAEEHGGGIFEREASVTLRGAASVTSNTAAVGGGVYAISGDVAVLDEATVSGNIPDDCVGC